jgi:hypothetical protein
VFLKHISDNTVLFYYSKQVRFPSEKSQNDIFEGNEKNRFNNISMTGCYYQIMKNGEFRRVGLRTV